MSDNVNCVIIVCVTILLLNLLWGKIVFTLFYDSIRFTSAIFKQLLRMNDNVKCVLIVCVTVLLLNLLWAKMFTIYFDSLTVYNNEIAAR